MTVCNTVANGIEIKNSYPTYSHAEIEKHIDEVIEKEAFFLNFQPKVFIASGDLCGYEALLRLPLLGGVYVQPGKVIDIIEKNGKIVEVGAFVIKETCRCLSVLSRNGIRLPLSVNVSASQFAAPGFFEYIQSQMICFGIENVSHLLEIEVTESMMLHDQEIVIMILSKLNGLGVKLSIDDFGVGYSSLSRLKNLPFDYLKIDKSFVDNIECSKKDRAVIETIVLLADKFEMEVIAEGVETKFQADWLLQAGCEMGQGFLFGKPQHFDEIIGCQPNET